MWDRHPQGLHSVPQHERTGAAGCHQINKARVGRGSPGMVGWGGWRNVGRGEGGQGKVREAGLQPPERPSTLKIPGVYMPHYRRRGEERLRDWGC